MFEVSLRQYLGLFGGEAKSDPMNFDKKNEANNGNFLGRHAILAGTAGSLLSGTCHLCKCNKKETPSA